MRVCVCVCGSELAEAGVCLKVVHDELRDLRGKNGKCVIVLCHLCVHVCACVCLCFVDSLCSHLE